MFSNDSIFYTSFKAYKEDCLIPFPVISEVALRVICPLT